VGEWEPHGEHGMMEWHTDERGGRMADEPRFQETKDGEPNIEPKHLGKPESLTDVAKSVIEGLVHFGEGDPPDGSKDSGHVEGANEGGA
jgi:hypothetical protein